MKKCYKCNEIKEEGLFSKNKAKYDGLASECKACSKIRLSSPDVRSRHNASRRLKNQPAIILRQQKEMDRILSPLKACSKCNQEKNKELFFRRSLLKDGLSSWCKQCTEEHRTKPEVMEASNKKERERRSKDPEKYNARHREYRARNPGSEKESGRLWREKNKDYLNNKARLHKQANRSRYNSYQQRREADKIKATPAWSEDFFIHEAYELAKLREQATGIKWHVDHIVPLRSKIVCGLHAHTNIQVIPEVVNRAKNNVWWPDMPEPEKITQAA